MRIGNFILQAFFASSLFITIHGFFLLAMAVPDATHHEIYYKALPSDVKSLLDDLEARRLVGGDGQHSRGDAPAVSLGELANVQKELQSWSSFDHTKHPKIVSCKLFVEFICFSHFQPLQAVQNALKTRGGFAKMMRSHGYPIE